MSRNGILTSHIYIFTVWKNTRIFFPYLHTYTYLLLYVYTRLYRRTHMCIYVSVQMLTGLLELLCTCKYIKDLKFITFMYFSYNYSRAPDKDESRKYLQILIASHRFWSLKFILEHFFVTGLAHFSPPPTLTSEHSRQKCVTLLSLNIIILWDECSTEVNMSGVWSL